MKHLFKAFACALSAVVLSAAPGTVMAQQYPSKPVKLIIPFPPSGATDVIGRALGQKLTESLGQPIVVENKPGAGSTIGADLVAKAAPDGYTLLLASGSIAISANLYKKLPFNPAKSFAPVSLVGHVPHVLVAHPSVPAATLKEFIAYAKQRPGQINAATQGNGTLSHMELEMLKDGANIDLMHIPYKGSSNATTDLLSGNVSVMFDSVTSALPMVKNGQLKAYAVVSAKRLPFAPDIPTFAEAGLQGLDAANWFALLAPAGTPKEVIQVLNTHVAKALAAPDMQQRLAAQGVILESSSPEAMADLIKTDLVRWNKVIQKAGSKLD
jgi:tripartite-type tricarboxylate transporter receptor subunit TctC